MKKIILAIAIIFIMTNYCYAERGVLTNASPVVVQLSSSSPYQEITFTPATRDLIIQNYDTDDGIWVNLRGSDTQGIKNTIAENSGYNRYYIPPSESLTLYDFMTTAITVIDDNSFTPTTFASPVIVITTY